MQRHTHYEMTVCAPSEGRLKWYDVPPQLKAAIQVGGRFGMLVLDATCDCCDRVLTNHCFFTLDDMDYVRIRLLDTSGLESDVVATVGKDVRGRFSPMKTSEGFDDAYILRNLAFVNHMGPNHTIDHVFNVLHNTIILRTAFRNLYFRAFRKAFAPGKNQWSNAVECYALEFGIDDGLRAS